MRLPCKHVEIRLGAPHRLVGAVAVGADRHRVPPCGSQAARSASKRERSSLRKKPAFPLCAGGRFLSLLAPSARAERTGLSPWYQEWMTPRRRFTRPKGLGWPRLVEALFPRRRLGASYWAGLREPLGGTARSASLLAACCCRGWCGLLDAGVDAIRPRGRRQGWSEEFCGVLAQVLGGFAPGLEAGAEPSQTSP